MKTSSLFSSTGIMTAPVRLYEPARDTWLDLDKPVPVPSWRVLFSWLATRATGLEDVKIFWGCLVRRSICGFELGRGLVHDMLFAIKKLKELGSSWLSEMIKNKLAIEFLEKCPNLTMFNLDPSRWRHHHDFRKRLSVQRKPVCISSADVFLVVQSHKGVQI